MQFMGISGVELLIGSAIVVVVAVVVGLRMKAMWQRVAEELGLTFNPGGQGGREPVFICGELDGVEVSVRYLVRWRGNFQHLGATMSVGAELSHPAPLEATILAKRWWNIPSRMMLGRGLKSGDPMLDKYFKFKCAEPAQLSELLGNPSLKEALIRRRDVVEYAAIKAGSLRVELGGLLVTQREFRACIEACAELARALDK